MTKEKILFIGGRADGKRLFVDPRQTRLVVPYSEPVSILATYAPDRPVKAAHYRIETLSAPAEHGSKPVTFKVAVYGDWPLGVALASLLAGYNPS